jgi:hypothetical protein
MFGVSRSTIQNLTDEPPGPEELALAETRLAEIRKERDESLPRFGPYVGDAALFMRTVFVGDYDLWDADGPLSVE